MNIAKTNYKVGQPEFAEKKLSIMKKKQSVEMVFFLSKLHRTLNQVYMFP